MVFGFTEPKQNSFIYKKLKPHSASIDDLRKFIANENNCDERHITFLKITDYKEVGSYDVCVDNEFMTYNRIDFAFSNVTNNIVRNKDPLGCFPSTRFIESNHWDKTAFFFILIITFFLFTISLCIQSIKKHHKD